jgi:hypothetical protein
LELSRVNRHAKATPARVRAKTRPRADELDHSRRRKRRGTKLLNTPAFAIARNGASSCTPNCNESASGPTSHGCVRRGTTTDSTRSHRAPAATRNLVLTTQIADHDTVVPLLLAVHDMNQPHAVYEKVRPSATLASPYLLEESTAHGSSPAPSCCYSLLSLGLFQTADPV